MTIDEAILHCEEKARAIWQTNEEMPHDCKLSKELCECAKEHEQLAEWLKELKDYREEKRTCENCKHESKSDKDFPCSICRCNHPNKFEWKEQKGGKE